MRLKLRRMASALILLLLGWGVCSASGLLGLDWLISRSPSRFTHEGFVLLDGLGVEDGMVVAVGDATGDQVLDLFLLNADQTSLSLWTWRKQAYAYAKAATILSTSRTITNVVPGDFNHDGRLDLLVMSQTNPGSWFGDDTTHLAVYLGKGDYAFDDPTELAPSVAAQPFVVDATGDMGANLLGFPKTDPLTLSLWNPSANDTLSQLSPAPLPNFQCKFPNPHSNAFIDLDGDCLADIFVTCVDPIDPARLTYQIWLNKKEAGFEYSQGGRLPPGTGVVSFADMDRDGTIDFVFPSCANGDCTINVAYNKQVPLCTHTLQTGCRESDELCTADPAFKFDLDQAGTNPDFLQFPVKSLLPSTPYLITQDKSFSGQLPIGIKIGDYDNDGYPDLFVIASASSSASAGSVHLLRSIPCSSKVCSDLATASGRRAFESHTHGAQALDAINDAKMVSFLDIDEQGSLDLLIQRETSHGASRALSFVKNNYYHDAFFLKALVINGACRGHCRDKETGKSYDPNGVSYSGASFKFTVFDPTGNRRATQVGQLPQTSYVSLTTPYSYFGLGRTNNYVENLFVGSTRHQQQHFTMIEGLIPNSQVLINPYQDPGSDSPDSWTKQLYLHPGDWVPGVTFSLIVAIVILVITIGVLHAKETREDEAERKKKQTVLNFDAL